MKLVFFETKRDAITRWIIEFFESIGINPFLGVALIGTVAILFRARSYLKNRKTEESYSKYDVFENIVLVIATIGVWIVALSS